MPPLRRTYASASLALSGLPGPTENVHHATLQPSPMAASVSFPTPTALHALQPIINLPAASSPRQSSLLGPRRLPLRRSLHPNRQIIPPFKPGKNLYRKVLKRQFLLATKKTTTNYFTTKQDPFFARLLPLSKTPASSNIKQKLSAVEANNISLVALELQPNERLGALLNP